MSNTLESNEFSIFFFESTSIVRKPKHTVHRNQMFMFKSQPFDRTLLLNMNLIQSFL